MIGIGFENSNISLGFRLFSEDMAAHGCFCIGNI